MSYKMTKERARLIAGAVILILIVVAAVLLKQSTIKQIVVTGNSFYSDDEVIELVQESQLDNNTIICYIKSHFAEEKEIPFIEKYQLEIVDRNTIEIIVYEKKIIGYVRYMESYLYFDRDGMIVESSPHKMEGICHITGLAFSKVILGEVLETGDRSVFNQILMMTQLFEKYKIDVKTIHFKEDGSVVIKSGDIRVNLGQADRMDGKISLLNDMLPQLEGEKGTLHLESDAATNGRYYFAKD